MKNKELKELKEKLMSCLTDKNTQFVQTENDDERFGALLALSYAFYMADKIFAEHNI